MKNFTGVTNIITTNNLKPLNLNDLTTIFGGNDDVINPDDLLGDGSIIDDVHEL
jgi:hypothetical protein